MRAVVQRVLEAAVRSGEEEVSRIGPGMFVLLGVARGDSDEVARRLARKVAAGRNRAMEGPLGPRLRESNGRWMAELRAWLESERKTGGIPFGSVAILHAVVFAPTQEISRLWLAGLLPRDLEDYRLPLAEAAWAGVSAAAGTGGDAGSRP